MATPPSISCYLRKLQMTYNNPLPRLNLTSPYPTNTKEELDMRRKAEVLKHQGPQKSTQMNTLSKKQKFAQVIRGYNAEQKALKSNRFTQEQMSFCDSSNNRTSSSSSGVPGPPILLYMDRSIPLYNYANRYQTYSDLPRPIEEALPWRFFANDQATSIVSQTETNIGVLQIMKDISFEVSTFTINIPGEYTPADLSGKVVLMVKYANQVVAFNNNVNPYTYLATSSNIKISNIQLYTVDGYFYEFFVTIINSTNVPFKMYGNNITISALS